MGSPSPAESDFTCLTEILCMGLEWLCPTPPPLSRATFPEPLLDCVLCGNAYSTRWKQFGCGFPHCILGACFTLQESKPSSGSRDRSLSFSSAWHVHNFQCIPL